jgi:hypothetical protein
MREQWPTCSSLYGVQFCHHHSLHGFSEVLPFSFSAFVKYFTRRSDYITWLLFVYTFPRPRRIRSVLNVNIKVWYKDLWSYSGLWHRFLWFALCAHVHLSRRYVFRTHCRVPSSPLEYKETFLSLLFLHCASSRALVSNILSHRPISSLERPLSYFFLDQVTPRKRDTVCCRAV